MAEKTSMPLSVLLAICTELNHYMPSQMAAARVWIDLEGGFVEILESVAEKVPDESVKDWILDELYTVNSK